MTKTTSTAADRRFASLTPDSRKAIDEAAARIDECRWRLTTWWQPARG